MARHGENIYRRKDGRYEGRFVIGRTERGGRGSATSTARSTPR